jgi:hypothetical protein
MIVTPRKRSIEVATDLALGSIRAYNVALFMGVGTALLPILLFALTDMSLVATLFGMSAWGIFFNLFIEPKLRIEMSFYNQHINYIIRTLRHKIYL